jgi:hypothetical protein
LVGTAGGREAETGRGTTVELMRKFWLLGASIAAIVLGFVSLADGRLSLGPLLLVGGYCVLLPFFLWRSFQKSVGE